MGRFGSPWSLFFGSPWSLFLPVLPFFKVFIGSFVGWFSCGGSGVMRFIIGYDGEDGGTRLCLRQARYHRHVIYIICKRRHQRFGHARQGQDIVGATCSRGNERGLPLIKGCRGHDQGQLSGRFYGGLYAITPSTFSRA